MTPPVNVAPYGSPLERLVSKPRLRVYLEQSGEDLSLAERLYVWDQALSGAWHTHLGYVEVAVRNAMDRELRRWNHRQRKPDGSCCQESWTLRGETGELLYRMIRPKLTEARRLAANEADRRPRKHHRYNRPVAHEDVLAQLTFGAWVRMVNSGPQQDRQKHDSQRELWTEALHNAFPGSPPDEKGRDFIGTLLERLRNLRNRVAHHENLLGVNTGKRLEDTLALLNAIDPAFPALVMRGNPLRSVARRDPRPSR